jgi:hydrogenase-4 component B
LSLSFALPISLLGLCVLTIAAVVTIGINGLWQRFSICFGHTLSMTGSLLLVLSGYLGLMENHPNRFQLQGYFSFTTIEYQINELSAGFLLLLGIISFFVSIYAIGYVKEYSKRKSVSVLLAGTHLFVATMASVLLAGNVFTFLLSWESMSIVSFLLVMYEDEKRDVQTAGFIYAAMTHVGTGFLTIAFFILSHYAKSFEFAQMHHVHMPILEQTLVFLFMFIGFATKAGLVPLHIWLPRSHPVAPSHISALMSGFMIKTAVYGFLLFTFQFAPEISSWSGIFTALIGALTAVTGVVYALSVTDQKRILAYSSVENMGLIFMGLGVSMIFTAEHLTTLATITLIATLVHLMNHAIFKSLLFLGSGSVFNATHVKNIDKLGGLIREMPWTACFVLIGCLSISALPPTNGFIGEWLMFQSLFGLALSGNPFYIHLLGILLIAILTFTAALAAMAFVRMFSMTFLSMPRSEYKEEVHEVGPAMKIGMAAFACFCLLIGILPGIVIPFVEKAARALTMQSVNPIRLFGNIMPSANPKAHLSPGITVIVILCGIGIAFAISRMIGGQTKVRIAETWACTNTLTPKMTYTASGYSKPIRMLFHFLVQPTRRLERASQKRSPYFPHRYIYVSQVHAVAERYIYRPFIRMLLNTAHTIRRIQNGHVQGYLAYMFFALIVVLILAK